MNLRPGRLRTKLLLLFVLVVTLAQFATWSIVSTFNRRQARRLIEEDLQKAALNFERLVGDRNFLQATGAQAAARDYEIKKLFVNEDPETLASALESLRLTIRSDLVAAMTLEGRPLASTSAAVPARGLYGRLIALAEADPSPNPTADGYGYFDGRLHSVILAPMRAPDIIAWFVIGFRIDREFAIELKRRTGTDLTFFDPDGKVLAGTLPDEVGRRLAAILPDLNETAASRDLDLGGETALVAGRPLLTGDRRAATLVLQYSLDEKLKPARLAENWLILIASGSLALAVFLSLAFARRLTRPIDELVGHTRRIARGDYRVRNTSYRADELGRLSEAFDQMSTGLAERDRVRDLLDKNVSPEVAAQLLRDGATLGGEEREVTILFADLRGFTTLSEQLPPRDLLTLLNRYLDRMSAAIEAHGGVIDKFIGDAIMALFGAPVTQDGAAARAVAAALAMEEALRTLNAEFVAEGRPPLAIGVGINTARVVAGNIGSQRRLNYSVIGDGVNVAARLQSLTRTPEYRTNLIASEATMRAAPAAAPWRALGPVVVKGRAEPIACFAAGA